MVPECKKFACGKGRGRDTDSILQHQEGVLVGCQTRLIVAGPEAQSCL